jgi:hypothetical protein
MSREIDMRNPSSAERLLVRSYVVRIYREDGEDLVGVVEDVQSGRSMSFSSIEGLRSALRESSGTPMQSVGVTASAQ